MNASANFTKDTENNLMKNGSNENGHGCTPDTDAARFAKIVFLSVILVMALFGNLLVVFVVCRNRSLRRTINFFILNIAVSDILIPVVVIPRALVELARNNSAWLLHGQFGEFICKLVYFLSDVSPAVSIASLIFMTVDRFLAVVFPLRVTLMNAKRRYALIALTWIISIGFFSPYFYAFELFPFNGEHYCVLSWSPVDADHTKTQKEYSTVISICLLVVPFSTLTTLYTIILVKTKTPDFIRSKYSAASRIRQKKTSKRLTFMAFLIVFIFGVCWGPYNIILFLQIFVWKWQKPTFCGWNSLLFAVQFLSYSNAAINPCVYFVFIKNFRRGLVKQFTTRKSRAELRRNKLCSETMLFSIHHTGKNAVAISGTECETCL